MNSPKAFWTKQLINQLNHQLNIPACLVYINNCCSLSQQNEEHSQLALLLSKRQNVWFYYNVLFIWDIQPTAYSHTPIYSSWAGKVACARCFLGIMTSSVSGVPREKPMGWNKTDKIKKKRRIIVVTMNYFASSKKTVCANQIWMVRLPQTNILSIGHWTSIRLRLHLKQFSTCLLPAQHRHRSCGCTGGQDGGAPQNSQNPTKINTLTVFSIHLIERH